MMAFPEKHQAYSSLEMLKNTVVAGFSAIKHFVTGSKSTSDSDERVQLQMPNNVEIRGESLNSYLDLYTNPLSLSYTSHETMLTCVKRISHILRSLCKLFVTTQSQPIAESGINVYGEKFSQKIKQVSCTHQI